MSAHPRITTRTVRVFAALAGFLWLATSTTPAAPILEREADAGSRAKTLEGFDAFVDEAIKSWEIPGLAILVHLAHDAPEIGDLGPRHRGPHALPVEDVVVRAGLPKNLSSGHIRW